MTGQTPGHKPQHNHAACKGRRLRPAHKHLIPVNCATQQHDSRGPTNRWLAHLASLLKGLRVSSQGRNEVGKRCSNDSGKCLSSQGLWTCVLASVLCLLRHLQSLEGAQLPASGTSCYKRQLCSMLSPSNDYVQASTACRQCNISSTIDTLKIDSADAALHTVQSMQKMCKPHAPPDPCCTDARNMIPAGTCLKPAGMQVGKKGWKGKAGWCRIRMCI